VVLPSTVTNLALRSAALRGALLSNSSSSADGGTREAADGARFPNFPTRDPLPIGGNTTLAVNGEDSLSLAMGQASLALAIFVVFYRLHHAVQPYAYQFQNTLDGWLFVADMAIVSLGALYTILLPHFRSAVPALSLEILLLTTIIGSVVLTATYLVYRSLRQRHRIPASASDDADAQHLAEEETPRSRGPSVAREDDLPLADEYGAYSQRHRASTVVSLAHCSFDRDVEASRAARCRGPESSLPTRLRASTNTLGRAPSLGIVSGLDAPVWDRNTSGGAVLVELPELVQLSLSGVHLQRTGCTSRVRRLQIQPLGSVVSGGI